jgi:hypothetical protein
VETKLIAGPSDAVKLPSYDKNSITLPFECINAIPSGCDSASEPPFCIPVKSMTVKPLGLDVATVASPYLFRAVGLPL